MYFKGRHKHTEPFWDGIFLVADSHIECPLCDNNNLHAVVQMGNTGNIPVTDGGKGI